MLAAAAAWRRTALRAPLLEPRLAIAHDHLQDVARGGPYALDWASRRLGHAPRGSPAGSDAARPSRVHQDDFGRLRALAGGDICSGWFAGFLWPFAVACDRLFRPGASLIRKRSQVRVLDRPFWDLQGFPAFRTSRSFGPDTSRTLWADRWPGTRPRRSQPARRARDRARNGVRRTEAHRRPHRRPPRLSRTPSRRDPRTPRLGTAPRDRLDRGPHRQVRGTPPRRRPATGKGRHTTCTTVLTSCVRSSAIGAIGGAGRPSALIAAAVGQSCEARRVTAARSALCAGVTACGRSARPRRAGGAGRGR
jgi:hypothetical protein